MFHRMSPSPPAPRRRHHLDSVQGAAPVAKGGLAGREVACALDGLRQKGRLGRDRDGRYHLVAATPGSTGIVGELYHAPNEGT